MLAAANLRKPRKAEDVLVDLDELSAADLLDHSVIARVCGFGTSTDVLDQAVSPRGYRLLARIDELPDFAVFARGVDPSAIANVTLAGVNVPIRIGNATVVPGDVVLGTSEGVTFIPPHLVQEVVERSEDVRLRDVFGKQRLAEGTYTSGQIDVSTWAVEIEQDFLRWREAHP